MRYKKYILLLLLCATSVLAATNGILLSPQIDGGLSAQKNYIKNGIAHKNTSGWATYDDGASATPVDGTAGATITTTFTRSTSSPLRGDGSFLVTTTAANLQGEGASYDFTIDTADQAKVLSINFDYAVDVTTATGDFIVYIYDVTNAALIQPAGYQIQGGVSGTQYKHIATFQTASNSTSYRLIIHRAVTTATATNLKIDNVYVGPQIVQYGAPVTDWVSFTPTGAWSSNTTYTGRWSRIGDSMLIQYFISTSGAPTSATLTLNLPSGYTIDTSKLAPGTASEQSLQSRVKILDSGTAEYQGDIRYSSTTALAVRYWDVSGTLIRSQAVTQAAPMTFASGDTIAVDVVVPITGWSSTVQMSNDTDTRVVAASYQTNAGNSIPNTGDNIIDFEDKVYDTHNAVTTGASWKFTAPVAGKYQVSVNILFSSLATTAGNAIDLQLFKNGSIQQRLRYKTLEAALTSFIGVNGIGTVDLNAGDYIDVRVSYNRTGGATTLHNSATYNTINIERISGPSAIAATETVAARWTKTGKTVSSGANSDIDNVTMVSDTHGALNTTTGVYTVPVSGFYRISGAAQTASTSFTTGSNRYWGLNIGGTNSIKLGMVSIWATATMYTGTGNSTTRYYTAGQTIVFNIDNQTGGTWTQSSTATENWYCVERVGN